MTQREAVLKVLEGYFKELLNRGGNNKVTKLYRRESGSCGDYGDRRKKMKNGRVPGIDEVRAEMLIAVGEIGGNWTKRLLNIYCYIGGGTN